MTAELLASDPDVAGEPFGVFAEDHNTIALNAYSDVFATTRIELKDSGEQTSYVLKSTPTGPVSGGSWLGPLKLNGAPSVISVGNDVRSWDLPN